MELQLKANQMEIRYRRLKADAKKLMLRGDLNKYFKKLLQITTLENEYRLLMENGDNMRAAA